MTVRKKLFRDQEDLANYLRSSASRVVPVVCEVSKVYPGMVRFVEIISDDAGRSLSLNCEYCSFGCDPGGRLTSMSWECDFDFDDLTALLEFVQAHCGVDVRELRTKAQEPESVPTPYDAPTLVESYGEGWRHFEADVKAGRIPEQQWRKD